MVHSVRKEPAPAEKLVNDDSAFTGYEEVCYKLLMAEKKDSKEREMRATQRLHLVLAVVTIVAIIAAVVLMWVLA